MNPKSNQYAAQAVTYSAKMFGGKQLHIPRELFLKMKSICHAALHDEFQWFVPVERKGNVFVMIDDIHVPDQTVTATTVKSTPTQMLGLLERKDPNVFLKGWCHSHVDMACSPSQRDYTDIAEQRSEITEYDDFRIMLIVNKRGETYAEVHTLEYQQVMLVTILEDNPYSDWATDIVLEHTVILPKKSINTGYKMPGYGGYSWENEV